MSSFEYRVHVEAPTQAQADQIMAERLLPEERYDFVDDYSINYAATEGQSS